MPLTSDSRRPHSVDVTECGRRANPTCPRELGSQERRSCHPDSLGWRTPMCRQQSRSWQGSACATCRCPDGTRPSTGILPATLTGQADLAPPRPASQHPHRHVKRYVKRKAAAAVLSVTRAGLDRTSTRNAGTYRRHDARAAAAHGMGCERRRKPRSAFSPYDTPWSAAAPWLMARPFARECTY